jgi:hypothetical protein
VVLSLVALWLVALSLEDEVVSVGIDGEEELRVVEFL